MGWWLLVGVAHALTFCLGPEVEEVVPLAGSTDVPLDAAIGLLSSIGNCDPSLFGQEIDVQLEALDADGELVSSVSEQVTIGLEHRVAWMESGLQANTEYRASGPSFEVGFRTGTTTTKPLVGEPGGGTFTLEYDRDADLFRVEAAIAPVPNPYGPSVVGLIDERHSARIYAAALAPDDEGITVTGDVSTAEDPAEICVHPAQWDSAGRLKLGPLLCADTGRGGCATSPGGAGAALVALVLLATRRARTPR